MRCGVSSTAELVLQNLTELSHSSKFANRRRNTPKSDHNRSESLCAGLWVPCRVLRAWFGPACGPNPARSRRLLAGSLKFVGALFELSRKRAPLFLTGRYAQPLGRLAASGATGFATEWFGGRRSTDVATGKFFLYVRAGPGGLPLASLCLPFASASASCFCLLPRSSCLSWARCVRMCKQKA